MSWDVKIVGAGLAGSVMAERLATAGKRVLVLDRRDHVGGNCFDELDSHGVLIHRYGPHIFRTASEKVREYLSQFTEWRLYEHRVLSRTKRGLLPIPVNATTLEKWFGVALPSELDVEEFLMTLQVPVEPAATSRDVCLSRVGSELYEALFRGYTIKQWGRDPSELAASVCGRIPVRTNRDDRYFSEPFQAVPKHGYTAMVDRMLDHPNIDVVLGVDGREFVRTDEAVIWTGCIDEAFDYCYDALPWRSLRFELESHVAPKMVQPVAVINEPDRDVPYTRTTEYRHITGQTHMWTSLHYEFPLPVGEGAEPYYPVPSPDSELMLRQYRGEAKKRPLWTFCGRLGRYQYLEMGQVVGQALKLANQLVP